VDTIPELITKKDALTSQILKEGNNILEKIIDTYVESNLSLDIPILVSRPFQKTITETSGSGRNLRRVTRTYNFTYDNYFYGAKATTMSTAAECSLVRGSSFGGRNATVETNRAFKMMPTQDSANTLCPS